MTYAALLAIAVLGALTATQPNAPPVADDQAIRTAIAEYVSARERRDPKAIEALFTEDADQHTTAGEWRRGREAVVRGTLESSARNPGTRRIEVASIRFLTPDVAIADGGYEISGPEGVRTMWTTIVLERAANKWMIAAIRNAVPTGSRQ